VADTVPIIPRFSLLPQDVITNLQQILVKTPPTLTSNTFVTVLHILVLMSSNGSDVGLLLLREKIGETLKRLLVADKSSTNKLSSAQTSSSSSSSQAKDDFELMRRNPPELYEITR
jgi:E3 ubiquitin-protein ligase TRIP12